MRVVQTSLTGLTLQSFLLIVMQIWSYPSNLPVSKTKRPAGFGGGLGERKLLLIRVFDAATVRLRLRNGHGFSGNHFIHGFAEVIARLGGVVKRVGLVVNRAVINECAALINDEHVRRCLHAVE